MVPVTMTARMTSTWRNVIMCPKPQPFVSGGASARGVFSSRKRSHGPIDLDQKLPAIDIDHKPVSSNDVRPVHQSPRSDRGICVHLDRSREAVKFGRAFTLRRGLSLRRGFPVQG
jgi:hypothetical protein